MKDSIMSLLQTVKLIHNVSQFYNTPERISSLMIKVGFTAVGISFWNFQLDLTPFWWKKKHYYRYRTKLNWRIYASTMQKKGPMSDEGQVFFSGSIMCIYVSSTWANRFVCWFTIEGLDGKKALVPQEIHYTKASSSSDLTGLHGWL